MSYNKKDILYLTSLKETIVENHQDCGGTGFLESGENCTCLKVFRLIKEFYKANIPQTCWNNNFQWSYISEETVKIVKKYINYLDLVNNNNLGLFITGELAVGKTSLLSEIAKDFVVKGFQVYYANTQNFLNMYWDEKKFFKKGILKKDAIFLDEFHAVYIKRGSSYVTSFLNDFLRNFIGAGKVICIASNTSLLNIDTVYSKAIQSYLSRYLREITLLDTGASAINADLIKKFERTNNYFNKNLRKQAELYNNFYESNNTTIIL